MTIDKARTACAVQQKKGLHFIAASVLIWCLVFAVQFLAVSQLTKNLLIFCCTVPLLPLAYLFSKFLHIPFQDKENPLGSLGLLFSMNQMLYLLIAMWVYPTVPDKLLMVIAMIFGAHLLPYSWLYRSRAYFVMAVVIPVAALVVGNLFAATVLAFMMIVFECVFTAWLVVENKGLKG